MREICKHAHIISIKTSPRPTSMQMTQEGQLRALLFVTVNSVRESTTALGAGSARASSSKLALSCAMAINLLVVSANSRIICYNSLVHIINVSGENKRIFVSCFPGQNHIYERAPAGDNPRSAWKPGGNSLCVPQMWSHNNCIPVSIRSKIRCSPYNVVGICIRI